VHPVLAHQVLYRLEHLAGGDDRVGLLPKLSVGLVARVELPGLQLLLLFLRVLQEVDGAPVHPDLPAFNGLREADRGVVQDDVELLHEGPELLGALGHPLFQGLVQLFELPHVALHVVAHLVEVDDELVGLPDAAFRPPLLFPHPQAGRELAGQLAQPLQGGDHPPGQRPGEGQRGEQDGEQDAEVFGVALEERLLERGHRLFQKQGPLREVAAGREDLVGGIFPALRDGEIGPGLRNPLIDPVPQVHQGPLAPLEGGHRLLIGAVTEDHPAVFVEQGEERAVALRVHLQKLLEAGEAQDAGDVARVGPLFYHRGEHGDDRLRLVDASHDHLREHRLEGALKARDEGAVGEVLADVGLAGFVQHRGVGGDGGAGIKDADALEVVVGACRLFQVGLHLGRGEPRGEIGQGDHRRLAAQHPVPDYQVGPAVFQGERAADILLGLAKVAAAPHGQKHQGGKQHAKGQKVVDQLAETGLLAPGPERVAGVAKPRQHRVDDAVHRLLGERHQGAVHRHPHDLMVEEVDQRHPPHDPEQGVRLDETHAPPDQQGHCGGLEREDQPGVGVVPQQVGVAGGQCGADEPRCRSQQLQGEHAEDAAEEKVDVEKDGIVEVVAGKGQEQKDGEQRVAEAGGSSSRGVRAFRQR